MRTSMIYQSIDINESIDRSIDSSKNPLLDESSYRWIDRSTNRRIQCYINPSIDQAIDRWSINLSSDHFRIYRIGRTREQKYKGERSETARQRFRKRKIKKKHIHPEARARAAGACLPLYCKYSAPRARLVYLLWTKGNCYSMTSRICKRSFGKFPTD